MKRFITKGRGSGRKVIPIGGSRRKIRMIYSKDIEDIEAKMRPLLKEIDASVKDKLKGKPDIVMNRLVFQIDGSAKRYYSDLLGFLAFRPVTETGGVRWTFLDNFRINMKFYFYDYPDGRRKQELLRKLKRYHKLVEKINEAKEMKVDVSL